MQIGKDVVDTQTRKYAPSIPTFSSCCCEHLVSHKASHLIEFYVYFSSSINYLTIVLKCQDNDSITIRTVPGN